MGICLNKIRGLVEAHAYLAEPCLQTRSAVRVRVRIAVTVTAVMVRVMVKNDTTCNSVKIVRLIITPTPTGITIGTVEKERTYCKRFGYTWSHCTYIRIEARPGCGRRRHEVRRCCKCTPHRFHSHRRLYGRKG